jgi:large subunit ribosomal protein L9
MKVILLENIKGTGTKGQLLEVSAGYARNFLLPRKMAKEATAGAINDLKVAQASKQHRLEQEISKAKEIAEKLKNKTLTFYAKAGKAGKLFGSITTKEIAEELKKVFAISVDKRKIFVNEDIKTFGTYECEVKLQSGISAKIYVTVNEKLNA